MKKQSYYYVLLSICVLPLCWASACGSKIEGGNGTDGNTHWLATCVTADDCDDGLSCLCGACTQDCSSDETCDDRSSGAAPLCEPLGCHGATAVSSCTSRELLDRQQSSDADASGDAASFSAVSMVGPTSMGAGDGISSPAEPVESSAVSDVVATEPGSDAASNALALGRVCIPDDEYSTQFSGFSLFDVGVDASAQCESGTCIVHQFQGRVSCPYGQEESAGECSTPDEGTVRVAVIPQLKERRPEDGVYCSCRCDGPDSAELCACPSGFSCAPLIPPVIPGRDDVVGSYCVKDGSYVNTDEVSMAPCEGELCGAPQESSAQALGVPVLEPGQPTTSMMIDELVLGDSEPRCLNIPLPIDDLGASCVIVEALFGEDPECSFAGRTTLSPETKNVFYKQLLSRAMCSSVDECERTIDLCEIEQLTPDSGSDFSTCLEDPKPTGDGWCYIDAEAGLGSKELVEECPANARRMIRMAGEGSPRPSTVTFVGCIGELRSE